MQQQPLLLPITLASSFLCTSDSSVSKFWHNSEFLNPSQTSRTCRQNLTEIHIYILLSRILPVAFMAVILLSLSKWRLRFV